MEQMSKAIDGVAKGAQEQSIAISKAAEITSKISTAIQQVTGNVSSVTKDSDASAEAARIGAATVQETLKGMQSIKSKVDISASKCKKWVSVLGNWRHRRNHRGYCLTDQSAGFERRHRSRSSW
jgi:methyl-accepting chemotaxis protein